MKFIQSFWSGQNNLTTHSFGWQSPLYHLMGWALSCLRLREYYTQVELYTDTAGYDLLINQLQLPYTKAYLVLDELNHYSAELWGLGKIRTYSLQDEPFIHVDGDVFIYQPFTQAVLKADFVVQNLEKASGHYSNVFKEIGSSLTFLPKEFNYQPSINETYSCNAGVIGGNDVSFFKSYAAAVFHFLEKNIIADIPSYVLANFNVLFEQVFFYNKAINESKKITTFFDIIFADNDYNFEEMADFTKAPFQNTYFHLIGSLKHNITVCELMSRALLKEYPDYYFKLLSLFSNPLVVSQSFSEGTNGIAGNIDYALTTAVNKWQENFTGDENKKAIEKPGINALNVFLLEAKSFETIINKTIKEYKEIPLSVLVERDIQSLSDTSFIYEPRENQLSTCLQKVDFVKLIPTVYNWTLFTNERRHVPDAENINEEVAIYIACVPACLFPYHKEIVLDELEQYILSLLVHSQTFGFLIKELENCFNEEDIRNNYKDFYKLVIAKMKYLIINKCLCVVHNVSC